MQRSSSILWAYHLTWILLLVLLLVFRFHPQTGLTSLVRFGEGWEGRRVPELLQIPYAVIPGQAGYDGQFYAQIALHPHLTDAVLSRAMDSVHYRARRIFLPLLAFVLGLGQPWWVLQIFSSLNLLGWFVLAWQLTYWLPPVSWENFGRWFFSVASAGVLGSLRSSLTDLPSLCLLLGALRFWELQRYPGTGFLLALTGLTRETMLLGGFFVVDRFRSWPRFVSLGLAAGTPILLWTLYLHHLFPEGDRSANNFDWPFVELFRTSREAFTYLIHGVEDRGRFTFRLLAVLGFAVQVWVLVRYPQPGNPLWRMSLPFLLLFPLLGAPVWEGYWAVCRTVLPLTIAFNLLLPSNRWFWPLLLVANLPTTLHGIFRLAF